MKTLIIVGSVRPNNKSTRVAKWLEQQLKKDGRLDPELINPEDLDLPFYNEEMGPFGLASSGKDYQNPKGRQWADKVKESKAFVIITPEYNHGYPAILKNTLDWVGPEWKHKPALLISHSWSSIGGSRAVEQLRQVLPELGLITATNAVNISAVSEKIDESGNNSDEGLSKFFAQSLEEFVTLAKKLNTN